MSAQGDSEMRKEEKEVDVRARATPREGAAAKLETGRSASPKRRSSSNNDKVPRMTELASGLARRL
jgi:hypothetical protein